MYIMYIYVMVMDPAMGPQEHWPQLKSDWPLKCPCPVTCY